MAAGTIWVGTNNGLIKLTRNHGVTWNDVTIPDLPNPTHADISAIDASHHDPATAYVAIDYHTSGDYQPYFYRTHDFGRTWTKIVAGLPTDQPSGSFARVIRSDTKKAGLLFAGTESSMYVSFDDGDHWESLTLNLPNTSYRDIVVKDNDLVVGTYGRGIWVLDDISPLRQITPAITSELAHLFTPGDAIRVRRDVNGDTPFPPEVPHALNPPPGAIIYYYLSARPSGDITVDVLDAAGKPVRHLSSASIAPFNEPPPPIPDFWMEPRTPLPTSVGTNRINWDLRYDSPPAFSHNYAQVMGAIPGGTPASPEGPLALPGVYTIKLTVDGHSNTQTVTFKKDQRAPATAVDLEAQQGLQMQLYAGAREAWDGHAAATALRAFVAEVAPARPAVATAAAALDSALGRLAGNAGGGGRGGGGRGGA
ncbi:MAG: WD40/YVTN/BNR-like repeat-containing protein, partial [Gemmatimonadales bacterium]